MASSSSLHSGAEIPGEYFSNIVPWMTSNVLPSPYVSDASSGAETAFQAFSGTNAYWETPSGTTTGWLSINLGTAYPVRHYALTSRAGGMAPKRWTFEGSDDGLTWDILDTRNGQGWQIDSSVQDIVLVCDNSGSMQGARITELKAAANTFITDVLALYPTQKIAIISFGLSATILQGLTTDESLLHAAINSLSGNEASTNYMAAIGAIESVFSSSLAQSKISFFLSDGLPTIGGIPVSSDYDGLVMAGITVNAMGIEVSEASHLRLMATETGGTYTELTDPDQILDALNETFGNITHYFYYVNSLPRQYYRLNVTANDGADRLAVVALHLSLDYLAVNSSSSSTANESSLSSSSTVEQNLHSFHGLSYALDCNGIASFGNAWFDKSWTGQSSGMIYRGGFDSVDPVYSPSFNGDNVHIPRGGLKKTVANNGAIYCKDASRILSLNEGRVSMRLNLPYSIQAGRYDPLIGQSDVILKDYVLWSVNSGDSYISPPGLYAALTPDGIEFTVWTASGKFTVLDTTSNIADNTDFIVECVWSGGVGGQISLLINYVSTAVLAASIKVSSGVNSLDGLPFWCMDSPAGTCGLNGILRRLETYRGGD